VKLHFLSGLPRSGSTLLTTLLYQNPLIHTEGVSALCDLMWNAQRSLDCDAIKSAHKQQIAENIVTSLPAMYYSNTTRPIVIDKCRAWTLPLNVKMLKHYYTPKIICCVRDIDEVVQSFVSLFERNGRNDFFGSPFESELQMAQAGLKSAIESNDTDTFLLVDYNDLIGDTQRELDRIYKFLGMKSFQHDLANIVTMNPVKDSVYGLEGMHYVRNTIGKRDES
jgi:sulfotransferase